MGKKKNRFVAIGHCCTTGQVVCRLPNREVSLERTCSEQLAEYERPSLNVVPYFSRFDVFLCHFRKVFLAQVGSLISKSFDVHIFYDSKKSFGSRLLFSNSAVNGFSKMPSKRTVDTGG